MSSVIALDNLEPQDRFNRLLEEYPADISSTAELVLLILAITDSCLESIVHTGSIYILDAGTLLSWLNESLDKPIGYAAYIMSLVILDESDMIFRFNCAKKFRIEDTSLKQLRINSWGKSYVRELTRNSVYKEVTARFNKICTERLADDFVIYDELVAQLKRSPITPKIALKIHQLNTGLQLQLLS